MNRRTARSALILLTAALSAGLLSGCAEKLDDLTDRAINAVGTRVSDAMEDVDVKEVLKSVVDKVDGMLGSMPETSTALKDTVSSLTSSFLNDVSSSAPSSPEESASPAVDGVYSAASDIQTTTIQQDGSYTGLDEVILYYQQYGALPANYLTTDAAKALGWDGESDLWAIQEGAAIGGDEYANLAGLLPSADGRNWKQCDVNYAGGARGPERLVYSNDGLLYYSPDRFTTFEAIQS